MTYQNPILPGFYPDPSVCRVGDTFYLVTSSFEYFPGVPIFRSRDLVNWEQIGHCLTRKSQIDLSGAYSSGGIFAPTIRYYDGRFYMVTTDTTGIGNFFVWTDDPCGEWSDPVRVAQGGIDPSFFRDDDGQVWITTSLTMEGHPPGICLNAVDLATGALRDPEPTWIWGGTGGKYPEGPHIYKKDGWYFLLISEGGTEFGHMVTVARSRQIEGPYEPCPHNPILTHRSLMSPIQSTGHADLFQDTRGDWWMVFLGVRHSGYPPYHHLGRETFLAPVTWPDDGWPFVNGGNPVELEMATGQDVTTTPVTPMPSREDFVGPDLGMEWNFCRNPVEGSWSIENGALTLRCLPCDLDGNGPKAWVGRRLQHHRAFCETHLDFDPAGNAEAGLTIYMNERHHAEIAIAQRDGLRVVVFRKTCGSLTNECSLPCPASGPVVLSIEADEVRMSFFAGEGEARREAGSMETKFLSTEMAGGFTGTYLALYATSHGAEPSGVARFATFTYQARE